MLEVRTLNFTLRLVQNPNPQVNGQGNYFIELSGESPFNVHKSFTEQFNLDAHELPFNSLEEVQKFVQETVNYWQNQIDKYPKLNITGLQELTDLWSNFALAFSHSPQLQVPQVALSAK